MIKALCLVFAPTATWNKIAEAQRGPLLVFLLNPLPLMVLGSLAEGFGLLEFGLVRGSFTGARPVPVELALVERYEAARLVLDLIVLFLGAKLLQWVVESFGTRIPFARVFAVTAYSLGPYYLARALDGIPQLNTWVCWAIGMALSLQLLYHGVALVLRPDVSKGFGMFIGCAIIMVLLTAGAQAMAVAVLNGKLLAGVNLPPLF